jgi:hypothetical protein
MKIDVGIFDPWELQFLTEKTNFPIINILQKTLLTFYL